MNPPFPRPMGPRLADLVPAPRARPAPAPIVWERTMAEKLNIVIAQVAVLEVQVAKLAADLAERAA